MSDVTATTGGGTGVLSHPGAVQTTVSTFANRTALFLELFGGEVLNAFNQAQVTMSRHKVRTIPNGKSARFPATWKTDAYEHDPGDELVMQQVQRRSGLDSGSQGEHVQRGVEGTKRDI